MKDDDKYMTFSTPRKTGKSEYYKRFMEMLKKDQMEPPSWIGIDWAKDSGMSRGDVIEKNENVVHVRFKTVTT